MTTPGDAEVLIPMDPFQLLGLPKRPLLSEEEIGAAYRQLAGNLHPDQEGGDASRFKELGEAASILRDPARRLRLLAGVAAGGMLPANASDLFPKVAALLQEADTLIARHSAATTPLARAVLTSPLKKLRGELTTVLGSLQEWHSGLEHRLILVDEGWPSHDPKEFSELADAFSYAIRWKSLLRERQLSLECL